MTGDFLDFEQPIVDLEIKIAELQKMSEEEEINLSAEILRLEKKAQALTKEIFAKLTPWQKTQLARHPKRPHTSDYIKHIFTDFDELHGDRMYADGGSIIAGLARLDGVPVMVMGHEKGRTTSDRIKRNFGMPHPEDYRKTARLMKMAEKFNLPIFTFIDTSGAYPGIGAEERGQSEAIAQNLALLSHLKTQIICTVIGEGGSGGALALGVGDSILMLQYAIYSVISPEGCASILWKSTEKAPQAAEALGITADRVESLGIIDEVVPEPLGSSYRDVDTMMKTLKKSLVANLKKLQAIEPMTELLERRYQRLMNYGLVQ